MATEGEANGDNKVFEFHIEPCALGGFLLSIRYGGGRYGTIAAGVWPSIEKAKEIAQANATKLLHGAEIKWLG